MRYQALALLTVLYAAMVVRADPAQLCAGDLKCDPGYCCSSSLLDKQDLPYVVTYEQLSQSTVGDLAKKLSEDGSHLMPEDKAKNLTIDSFLQGQIKSAAPPNPLPADSTQNTTPRVDSVTKAPSASAETTKSVSSANRMGLDKMSSLAFGVLALLI
ncbi:hypothetical protein BGZ76_007831 [Entomortierella beljakovae]|nr:hypothetical protein BGZ76_007831 [Entomortierella beljakovae]